MTVRFQIWKLALMDLFGLNISLVNQIFPNASEAISRKIVISLRPILFSSIISIILIIDC